MEARNTPILSANHPNLLDFVRAHTSASSFVQENGKRANETVDGHGGKRKKEEKGMRVLRLVSSLVLPRDDESGEITASKEMGAAAKWATLRQELSKAGGVVEGLVEFDTAAPPKTTVVQHRNVYNQEGRVPKIVRKQHQIILLRPESTTATQLTLLALESVDYDDVYIMCASWIKSDANGWMKDCAKGEGGLLDSLVALREREEVRLTGVLKMMLVDDDIELLLVIDVELVEKIWTSWESTGKRIFIKHLFSLENNAGQDDPTPEDFYDALKRAPVTRGGLRVDDVLGEREEDVVMQAVEETDEEKATRARQQAKGKGKERVPFIDLDDNTASTSSTSALPSTSASSDTYEGAQASSRTPVDDPFLKPVGLLCDLMPFQSRTVRWLLAREGKYVAMVDQPRKDAPIPAVARKGKGKASMDRTMPMIEGDEPDDGEEEEEVDVVTQVQELRDLPCAHLLRIRRGPLWERQTLTTLGEDAVSMDTMQEIWLNRLNSQISIEDPANWTFDVEPADDDVKIMDDEEDVESAESQNSFTAGTMLCTEMGLGKTVEVLSLILLNSQACRNRLPSYRNEELETDVEMTGITLVITPAALVEQWEKEIRKHAPSLDVLRYDSLKSLKKLSKTQIKSMDIVLTTFDVLKKEMNIATKPHSRSMRQPNRGYERSFFIRYNFLRVVMDEVQLLGERTSKASLTCALIARKFSLAVSGTPLLHKIEDVQPLLRFLRMEPLGTSRAALSRMLKDKELFERVVGVLGERTTKIAVQHEISLPTQSRYLVPVEFEAVERYSYDGRYNAALEELGFDLSTGAPKENYDANGYEIPWVPEKQVMVRWLSILRLLCIHPQGGQGGQLGLAKVKHVDGQAGGNLGTLEETLARMLQNLKSTANTNKRALTAAKVSRGLYTMHDRENCTRFEDAINLFAEARSYLQPVIEEVIESINALWLERKAEAAQRDRSASTASHQLEGDDHIGNLLSIDVDNDASAEQIPANLSRSTALRLRLRELLMVKHQALFFTGSACFNLGKFSLEENEAYLAAEQLRTTIITPYEKVVQQSQKKLRASMKARDDKTPFDLPSFEFKFVPLKNRPGLVTREIFARVEETTNALNAYAELLWQARDVVLQIVYSDVKNNSGDDADGEEYGAGAELQEKGDIYLEGMRLLLADWRLAITGEKTALNEIDEKTPFSKKDVWKSAAGSKRQRKSDHDAPASTAPRLAPDSTPGEILQHELWTERTGAKGGVREIKPIRELIKQLKEVSDMSDRVEERAIAALETKRLSGEYAEKSKIIDRMRTELSEITSAFNARIEYYVQLQKLSDDVSDPNFSARSWKGITEEIEMKLAEEAKFEIEIINSSVQIRYLTSLTDQPEEDGGSYCVICTESYDKGILTACGHMFCESCFKMWRDTSSSCPICKRYLAGGDWQRIIYRKDPVEEVEATGAQVVEDTQRPRVQGAPLERVKLNYIDPAELLKIADIDTTHRLSAKSTLIVKHVKYIQRSDVAAKIVLFSTHTESLAILMQAFTRAGIGFGRLEGTRGKAAAIEGFINNPSIGVFFLHTRSAAAGLNLTCAQYIFLIEPLLQASVEQQSISRIHRIGQTKETKVFQFFVVDSVDQRVAELRARQGTSLFLEDSAQLAGQTDTAEEVMDDVNNLAFCLLEPAHLNALQRSLLPSHLRGEPLLDYLPPNQAEGAY